ncbi:MAG: hypothetical protein H0T42_13650 [Deltaproteobacteria bacterium]|nr:hypothetical protein [Deltaproteobacteria bacterium]
MGRPKVVIDLHEANCARDLFAGGMFVGSAAIAAAGCALAFNDEVDLVVRSGNRELTLHARVVFVDPATGAGLELLGFDAGMKERIAQLGELELAPAEPDPGSEPEPEPEPDPDPDSDSDSDPDAVPGETSEAGTARKKLALNMHERLRGLTMVEQLKRANSNDPTERMTLERIYGKTVWEALLRNPRLTAPEVARLARMGSMPRTLIELIINNGSWLQIAEVRRALLGNPRLGVDQILRVLRLLSKPELKVAASLMTYPHAVRDAAKRLLKGADS